jgi:hypothetical protein
MLQQFPATSNTFACAVAYNPRPSPATCTPHRASGGSSDSSSGIVKPDLDQSRLVVHNSPHTQGGIWDIAGHMLFSGTSACDTAFAQHFNKPCSNRNAFHMFWLSPKYLLVWGMWPRLVRHKSPHNVCFGIFREGKFWELIKRVENILQTCYVQQTWNTCLIQCVVKLQNSPKLALTISVNILNTSMCWECALQPKVARRRGN